MGFKKWFKRSDWSRELHPLREVVARSRGSNGQNRGDLGINASRTEETNRDAFLSRCRPARHLQVSGGGVLRGAPPQLPRRALRGGAHQASRRVQEAGRRATGGGGGGLCLWHFRYGVWHDAGDPIGSDEVVTNAMRLDVKRWPANTNTCRAAVCRGRAGQSAVGFARVFHSRTCRVFGVRVHECIMWPF